ncbi:MAG: ABC transporter permease [Caulobacteraceae bacterium]
MDNANIAGAFLALLASSFAFIGLGLMAAVLPLLSTEKGAQATNIIAGFLLLISGIYYPVEALLEWLQFFSSISPATYTLEAIKRCLIQGASLGDVLPEIILILVIGAALIPLGLYIFGIAENYAMRSGKLKRNG